MMSGQSGLVEERKRKEMAAQEPMSAKNDRRRRRIRPAEY
jgi:hypothetical protein